MIKVAKFGGSSVADSNQFKKIKNIISSDEKRHIVVVSAGGKRFKDDNKITDLLYLCHAHIKYKVNYDWIMATIESRYREIKNSLNLSIDLDKEFDEIKKLMKSNIPEDFLVSRGEYLTAKLMADYLGYSFIDAKDIIHFQYDGKVNMKKTKEAIVTAIDKCPKAVIPGFYGSLPNGDIKLFSRGGSDITGSIVANCVDAELYENWTDVSGILMADPNIIKNPKQIEILTYNELRELSYMGADVLHTDAVYPVKIANIPINIRNTNCPENNGTLIVNEGSELLEENKKNIITGIAGRKDFTSISFYKDGISNEIGAIKRVLEIFEKYGLNVEQVPTGVDTFSVVVSTKSLNGKAFELLTDIKNYCNIENIKFNDGISFISIVGRNMAKTPGISGKIFGAVGDMGINIKTISQSPDEINIIIGVDNNNFKKTIETIYNKFIT